MTGTDKGVDDIEILYPERVIEVAHETVTVRELSFMEGIRLRPAVDPIIADLTELMLDDDDVGLDMLEALLARHTEAWITLMATAVDRDAAWVQALSDHDGQLLTLTFWEVNSGFFTRRLVMSSLNHHQPASDSPPSTPH